MSALGADHRFTGLQFHFHHGSEHTVDGKRHDLEMHTVHQASETKGGVGFAAMGIIFSVNDANIELTSDQQKVIDDFFDSLQWDQTSTNPKVAEVPYGKLMMMVNMRERWVYKGSVTTPPCATYVYWNVLTTIYPIKQSVLDNFKKQLARTKDLEKYGNYRLIQKLDKQDPKILKIRDPKPPAIFLVLFIVFAVLTLIFIATTLKFYSKANGPSTAVANTAAEPGKVEMM